MAQGLLLGGTVVASSALAVLGALLLVVGLSRRGSVGFSGAPADLSGHDAAFVFRDETLVDCSDRGRQLLRSLAAADGHDTTDCGRLIAYLAARFHGLDAALRGAVGAPPQTLPAQDDSGLQLHVAHRRGLTHLRLVDTQVEGALVALDRLSFEAMRDELDTLRAAARAAPLLIWQVDASGAVIWANAAYLAALQDSGQPHTQLTWPLPALFDTATHDDGRLSRPLADGTAWYAHHAAPAERGTLHFATPIDEEVQSEAARRQTLQMLTRTFASLPIGLALFDAERRLQVFNPALVDLTGLDPLFLAARPTLEKVLYALRELRVLPEPRDFDTWRREVAAMEQAAEDGAYAEEWMLASGRVFQVSGRPQPEGAIAFFIEDVTSDATLARGFRAEIDCAQSVLDGLPDAIVAFGPGGDTVQANAAYTALWDDAPCEDLADRGVDRALALWSERCGPSPFWARFADFAANPGRAPVLTGSVCLPDGAPLAVQACHLPSGLLLVTFRKLAQDSASVPARPDTVRAQLAAPDAADPPPAAPTPDAGAPRTGRGVRHSGSRVRA